ncbi:spore germination protein [Anaerobacillus alkaliphilus]|uniref:Spore germination protein n=1 Tax=Anaerobacillus alkaliphilus TaxID=1548597 RepID=A0A4Q0W015_9BACI|nr:spore germination protein [Anaerobacillus alkaliphilus]RXJ04151.1 spore germination protein [Anaerobacillus alkaliphilus]
MKGELISSLDRNLNKILKGLGNSNDILIRKLIIGNTEKLAAIIYMDGVTENEKVEEQIIKPLISTSLHDQSNLMELIKLRVVQTIRAKEIDSIDGVIQELIQGKSILVVDKENVALALDTVKWPERAAPEPKAQRTPRGPDIGFNESLTFNLSLIRKSIRDCKLRIESNENPNINTSFSLVYLENSVDQDMLKLLKSKLQEIDIPVVLDSSFLEENLTNETTSMFPLTLTTDRPDLVSAEILEGKIAIVVDGTPFVTVLPIIFIQLFQSPDDYYSLARNFQSRRLARMFFFFLSILLPALYISFTVYQPGLLPTSILIGFVAQREVVPFPTVVEIIVFFWLIIIIVESSLRLPQGVVLTVTIFASITLGQQAVEAQLVQPTTLVVLAASYIMSSSVPVFSLTVVYRILTFRFIFLASLLGLYGVMIGIVVLILHLSALRSFGVPYLSPVAPFNLKDQKDAIFRTPMEFIITSKKKFTKEEPMKKE